MRCLERVVPIVTRRPNTAHGRPKVAGLHASRMGQRSSRKQNPPVHNNPDSGGPITRTTHSNSSLQRRDRYCNSSEVIGARPDEVVGYVPECVGEVTAREQLPPQTQVPMPKTRVVHLPLSQPRRIPWSIQPPQPPPPPPPSRFGYEIQDLDGFLSQASLQNPANIPVVLASSCVLYQTQKKCSRYEHIPGCKGDRECSQKVTTDYQCDYEKTEQIFLPLGMVVNAVFKNKGWLYVQTPHGEAGYVSAKVCLPLGILPPPPPPNRPSLSCTGARTTREHYWGYGCPPNKTDTEKLRDTVSEGGDMRYKAQRRRRGGCKGVHHIQPEEAAVDRLFLKATAATSVASTCGGRSRRRFGGQRETLLLIRSDYHSAAYDTISVDKGDVVALVSHPLDDWFWVRAHDGTEGFIPSAIAGHGYI